MTDATLSAKVTADIVDFNKKFGELHHAVDGLAKKVEGPAAAAGSASAAIEQATGRWTTSFLAVGAAVGAVGLTVVSTIGEWTRAAAAAAEETEHIAQQTGIAAQTLESWSVALNRVGLDANTFSQAFRSLSKDIVKAQGAANFSETTFAKLGLTLEQLGSTEQVIRAVADRFAAMPDGAQKAQLAIDLFGRAGLKLIPVLNQGAAGLDAAARKAIEFGLVLDDSARSDLVRYDDALDDLGKAWDGLKTQVAVAAAPILLKAVELAASGVTMSIKIVGSIGQMVGEVRLFFGQLGEILVSVRAKTEAVTGFFKGMYDAVVGRSYVPDMVDDIGRQMQQLDVAMTAPARNATVNTAKIFEGLAFTTQSAMNQVVSTINFSWGSATQTVSNALAQMTSRQVIWAQVGIQIGQQFLGAMINQLFQLTTQWLLSNALRVASQTATNAAIVASDTATSATRLAIAQSEAVAEVGIMAGAKTTILAMFGAVGAALKALFVETLIPAIVAVGQFIMGVLSAIAAAMKSTIFGIPVGIAVLVGVIAIGVALAAAGAIKFAHGGIVTGPTMGLIGEAGPEAAIPLNRRGAAFMQNAFGFESPGGLGGRTPITIVLELDGRVLGRAVVPFLHDRMRAQAIGV